VRVRLEAEDDIVEAAAWYESRCSGLGKVFVEEVFEVLDGLAVNPLLSSRRHQTEHTVELSQAFSLQSDI
jgi:hypothetical protein